MQHILTFVDSVSHLDLLHFGTRRVSIGADMLLATFPTIIIFLSIILWVISAWSLFFVARLPFLFSGLDVRSLD